MPRFDEYRIRDPFVLVADGKYYMYESGTTEASTYARQIFVRVSEDLVHFTEKRGVLSITPAGL